MKVIFLLAFGLLVFAQLTESGRILRTWRRRSSGPGRMTQFRPHMRRSHYAPPWRFFRRPRTIIHPPPMGENGRMDDIPPFRDFPKGRDEPRQHGFTIQRDPTTHYAPPPEDDINLGQQTAGRRSTGFAPMRKFRPWRRPPPPVSHISLWKLLTMKHRRRFRPRRPFPPPPHRPLRPHDSSEEAEVTPHLPNIVYFLPKDTVTTKHKGITEAPEKNKTDGLKPGFVSDVPLYPTEATSASEFKPVTASPPPAAAKEYILKVVDVRKPTLLQPVSTKPSIEIEPTKNSAPIPEKMDSTETLLHELLQDPPSPINSFNININPNAEGSDSFIKVIPSSFIDTETTTQKSSSEFTIKSTTFKPKYAVRVIMPPVDSEDTQITTTSSKEKKSYKNSKEKISKYSSKEEQKSKGSKEKSGHYYDSKEKKYVVNSEKMDENDLTLTAGGEVVQEQDDVVIDLIPSSTSTKAPLRIAPAYKYPTMKPYVRNINKPIVVTPSTKLRSSVTTSTSSSESISITGVRSKVKEYKPSVLATAPGLLVFDKVDQGTSAEVTVPMSMSSTTTSSPQDDKEATTTTVSTTLSPMQKFDPMKMIHSWLTKAKPS